LIAVYFSAEYDAPRGFGVTWKHSAGLAEIFQGNCYKNGLLPVTLGDDGCRNCSTGTQLDAFSSTSHNEREITGFMLHFCLMARPVGVI